MRERPPETGDLERSLLFHNTVDGASTRVHPRGWTTKESVSRFGKVSVDLADDSSFNTFCCEIYALDPLGVIF